MQNIPLVCWLSLLSVGCVSPQPCHGGVSCVRATTEVPVSVGSLILHFEDNSTRKIEYRSGMECEVINMKPEHPIVRVVVASAHFVLYNRRDRRGRQYPVSSTREKEYSAQELGFTKVGRYIQALIGPAPSLLRSHWSRAS